jgi:hypothetical protein
MYFTNMYNISGMDWKLDIDAHIYLKLSFNFQIFFQTFMNFLG